VEPLAPHEKILIDEDFLEGPHGETACVDCHGGNNKEKDWRKAHKGVIRDPSFPDASKSCGECHEDIVKNYKKSVHINLHPYYVLIYGRGGGRPAVKDKINLAMKNHCSECHSSCGQCHVSRPDSVEGGFLDGHLFQKRPPQAEVCTACHGSRIEREYTGKNKGYPADVHYKKGMSCEKCHTGAEMHGTNTIPNHRYLVENAPRCVKCHKDAASKKSKVLAHRKHSGKLSCYVCHSVAYKNCYSCHVGKDKKGLPYFKTAKSEMMFKIGLNQKPDKLHPYKYVLLRHVPVSRHTFDFYVKDALVDFDKIPTWKMATPHNIQKLTPQNSQCKNCHTNKEFFLREKDLLPEEKKANQSVVVPENILPITIGKKRR